METIETKENIKDEFMRHVSKSYDNAIKLDGGKYKVESFEINLIKRGTKWIIKQ